MHVMSVRVLIAAAAVALVAGMAGAQDRQTVERDLATLNEAAQIFTSITDPGAVMRLDGTRIRAAFAYSTPIAQDMTRRLAVIAAATNPAALEGEYRIWKDSRRTDLFEGLVRIVRILQERKIQATQMDSAAWTEFVKTVADIVNRVAVPSGTPSEADLPALKAAYWKLRLVESARMAADKLPAMQQAIERGDAAVALEREVTAVKKALTESIKAGRPDAALEMRIAALPEDRRAEVGQVRAEQQAARATELEAARQKQERDEAAARRQRQIDDAIRLRKVEIDTGKADPKAEEARRKDPALARAVSDWETVYRKELADKKAAEARAQVLAAERAKIEAAQKRQAEALARQQQAAAQERENRLRSFGVVATVVGDELVVNPFQYQDKAVILVGVRFKRMMERNVGIFETIRGQEMVISGLRVDMFTTPGQSRELVVRVKGKIEGQNMLGVPMQVPHVQFLGTP